MFTTPRAGVYLITFSYLSWNEGYGDGEGTDVSIYKNGVQISETRHNTFYSGKASGQVKSTGGRAVYQRLGAGDSLTLQCETVTGNLYYFNRIMFYIQFINN